MSKPVSTERIAALEWANYAVLQQIAEVTPGLHVDLRSDRIINTSAFPTVDANHACLIRTTSGRMETIVDEVVARFRLNPRRPSFFLSPACTPSQFADYLMERGFTRQETEEAWLIFDRLGERELLEPDSSIAVRSIRREEVGAVSTVFCRSFGMSRLLIPLLRWYLAPSLGLEDVHYYAAFVDERPVGTCFWRRHGDIGILGGVGVVPEVRRTRVATTLVVRAMADAAKDGVETVIIQTEANTPLERLLRISGFERAFTRTCFSR